MTGVIWLLVESPNDGQILQTLIRHHYPDVAVEYLKPPGKPSITTLDTNLSDLIQLARGGKPRRPFGPNDCIAVVHDDDHSERDRRHHDRIAETCRSHGVVEIIARDEIEAWLLSDSGVCRWLNTRQETCNTETRPSDRLKSLMNAQKRLRYPGDTDRVLRELAFDSTNESY
ncbi:MAG: hypothetical protein WA009_10550 [Phototrophicaceae bacterium]